MFDRAVLGLDLGSYSIKAVELRADLRSMKFVRFEEQLLPRAASSDEIEAAVESFLAERDLPLEWLVGALPTTKVTQRSLRFPFRGSRRVAQAVDFQIHEEIPFPLEDTVRAHEQVSLAGDQTEVLVVIAPREDVRAYLDAMRRMRAEPRIVDVEGAVLANLSRQLEDPKLGRVILDVGHSKTNLVLLAGGRPVLLRRIPIAGRHFTEAIAEDMGLSIEDARAHKHEYGVFETGSTKPVSQTLDGALERLARETLRSLQSHVVDAVDTVSPSQLLVVGGSASLTGLSAFLSERTGLEASKLSLDDGPRLDADPSRFAQAAALAVRGAGRRAATRIDFRRGEFAYTADLSALKRQLQLTLALFALVLALWMASTVSEMLISESQVDRLQQTVSSIHRQTFPNSRATGNFMQEMETEYGRTRELADHLGVTGRGLTILDALREISARVPANLDITLDELRIDSKNIIGRGHTPDFVSADQLRRELSHIEGFGRVLVSDVATDSRRGGKSFTLKIRLEEGS